MERKSGKQQNRRSRGKRQWKWDIGDAAAHYHLGRVENKEINDTLTVKSLR